MKHKKIAKTLFAIWATSYVVLGTMSNAYILHQQHVYGYNPITMLSGYQIAHLLVMLLYFLPMLLIIRYYAKRAEMKKLYIFSCILGALMALWCILLLVTTILALIYPNMF